MQFGEIAVVWRCVVWCSGNQFVKTRVSWDHLVLVIPRPQVTEIPNFKFIIYIYILKKSINKLIKIE
jgi:hypothetical protein